MTVKELINKLQQFDEDKLVILKAGSNRAGFIKFDD